MSVEHHSPRQQILSERGQSGMLKVVIVRRNRFQDGACTRDQVCQKLGVGLRGIVQNLAKKHAREKAAQALAAVPAEMKPCRVFTPCLLRNPGFTLSNNVAERFGCIDGRDVIVERQQRF